VRRPNGQRKLPDEAAPSYGPCRNLDYELELGVWIGPGNTLGEPIPIAQAHAHVAGYCLLNDWSARDIQTWESQPLGPFLAKNFCTSISPWIITADAMTPFRIPQPKRPEGDPAPLAYLHAEYDQLHGALNLELEAYLLTPVMRTRGMAPQRMSLGNADQLYWTFAQMVAHHTSGGCNLLPGDLFGSGTISTAEDTGWGSLLELTRAGRQTITLDSGETRRFLEDGDEVIFQARAHRQGFASIGFGVCRGTVLPAL
jgi:fumarylacetoacetase